MQRNMRWLFLFLAACLLAVPAWAEVTAASLFGNDMVLQQQAPIPVWGRASPGEQVTVRFANRTARATADAQGKWRVTLKALKASAKPRAMVITGKNTLTFTDVLVGEVWVCSGQSNMEFTLAGAKNGLAETAAAQYPQIRMFTVGKNPAPLPQERCDGCWAVCTPENAPAFSAVGYFFARELYQRLQVPIGMIHTSWGGTPAETWTSLAMMKTLPQFTQRAADFERTVKEYLAHKAEYDQRHADETKRADVLRAAWFKQQEEKDPGYREHWADPAFVPQGWKTVQTPVVWGNNPLGQYLGTLWFRKTVEIPAAWVGKELDLHLGALDETDNSFVNGRQVGSIWYDTPNFWLVRRVYPVPAAAVNSTKVTIAIRLFNLVGDIGPFGPAREMYLAPRGAGQENAVSLAGNWDYTAGLAVNPSEVPQANYTPVPGTSAWDPSTLYNGMINPLVPYAIRGAIWYQGESNAGAPFAYRELLPGLITCWRSAWSEGNFPFGIVQLANFMGVQSAPIEKQSWAELREAQLLTLQTPNTMLATIIDIGEGPDIHPKNKQDVGKRLALPMLAKVYGKKLEYSGPAFRSLALEGRALRLRFDHAAGLTAKGGKLVGFAIAGPDKTFHVAQAQIDGETVVVSSPLVPNPIAVRYAWANNPVCNLYNAAGLPASPFRTDDWLPEVVGVAPEPAALP